jgi:hypothetical protein
VLYDLYFLSPQFHFLSNLVPVIYEKTEMVPPSDFPSKTNVQPHHPTGVGVHAQHLSPWYTSALTWLSFFFIIILIIYFLKKKKIFKIIYIDFILFYFLTYPHKKRRKIQTSNFHFHVAWSPGDWDIPWEQKYINCVQSTMCDIFIKPRCHLW